eukprot:gene25619-34187_t
MWSNVFNTKNRFDKTSFEQFQVTDLREENSELRRQITSLYSQLLNSDSLRDTTNMSTSTSTKSSRHASREFNNSYSKIAITEEYRNPMSIAEESILGLERELETHKAYIKEQANVAKELERKCQQKDEELLRLSLEVVQSIPLKTRIKELKKTNDDLNQTIGQLRAECSTLHTQIQELQEDREKQDSIIQQQEKEITCLGEKCSTAESEFQECQRRASLESASQLRVGALEQELQLEREKNDIKVKNSTVSSIGDEGDNASEAKGGKGKSNRADQPEDVEMVDCMCSGLSFFGQGGRAKYFT